MRGSKALWATASVIALTASVSLLPSQATAQINIPGMVFGAIHGGIPNNGSYGNSRRARTHETKHSKDAKGDDEPSEHSSSASNSKSGGEQELSAPVRSDPHPPSQPQPQTAASVPTPKSSGEEPSFSPSR
jgi:hypothetical protein